MEKIQKNIPSEHDEQCAFVEWLEGNGYRFSAIPNATWTSFSQQKKNKIEGVRPGLPDLLVIVKNHLVWIEMKRSDLKPKRGGRGGLSPYQISWIEALNGCENCQVYVCYGYSEAVDAIHSVAALP